MVSTCLTFIRSGQNHLAGHRDRGKQTSQTEKVVGRQHQGMDRPGVRQVPEGSGEQRKMEKLVVKSFVVPQRPPRFPKVKVRKCLPSYWLLPSVLPVDVFDAFQTAESQRRRGQTRAIHCRPVGSSQLRSAGSCPVLIADHGPTLDRLPEKKIACSYLSWQSSFKNSIQLFNKESFPNIKMHC